MHSSCYCTQQRLCGKAQSSSLTSKPSVFRSSIPSRCPVSDLWSLAAPLKHATFGAWDATLAVMRFETWDVYVGPGGGSRVGGFAGSDMGRDREVTRLWDMRRETPPPVGGVPPEAGWDMKAKGKPRSSISHLQAMTSRRRFISKLPVPQCLGPFWLGCLGL